MPARHAYWLDWGRFLAALIVCLGHARGHIWLEWGALDADSRGAGVFALFALGRLGHEAVVFFFVLSGFFVGGPCLAALRDREFSPRRYWVDRLTRLYPPYLAAILLTLCVTAIATQPVATTPGIILGQIFLVQGVGVPVMPGNSPLWSLAYEAWFYVLAGALCTLRVRRGGVSRVVCGLLLCAAVAWLTLAGPVYLVCWVFGALAHAGVNTSRRGALAWLGAGLALFGSVSLQAGRHSAGFEFAFPNIPPALAIIALSGGFALFLPWLSRLAPRTSGLRLLEAAGRPLAAFSFSLYLIHQPLLDLALGVASPRRASVDFASLALLAGLMAGLLICAWVFSRLFESTTPVLRARILATDHAPPVDR